MRRRVFTLLLIASFAAWAQTRPPKLEPLPEPPPPPPLPAGPAADEPRVRIPVQEGDKIEPVRRNGVVIAVRVTPPNGKPYFLIDTSGNGNWMRRDSLDTGLAVPMFPILEFD
ncbi:MAG TPA: DUF2782 domain-containing protein [Burkholderiales bacterium]